MQRTGCRRSGVGKARWAAAAAVQITDVAVEVASTWIVLGIEVRADRIGWYLGGGCETEESGGFPAQRKNSRNDITTMLLSAEGAFLTAWVSRGSSRIR